MSLPDWLESRLQLPVIAAPMFIVSQLELVLAQCRSGIVGSFPSLNARPDGVFEQWLVRLNAELTDNDAPFAVNLIVHRSNARLERDIEICHRHKVPIWITSLGARPEVNAAAHDCGGIALHDVINDRFARKAIDKGADGLIAVAAGAGGHAGLQSPFALVQEIRDWFDGPLLLSGAIATGRAVLSAQAMGADLAYIGSPFIATDEANAPPEYKRMIVESNAMDIVTSSLFTGVSGNYLAPSIRAAGLDPDNLGSADARAMNFGDNAAKAKAWSQIWGSGQGIGAVRDVLPAGQRIEMLARDHAEAKRMLCAA